MLTLAFYPRSAVLDCCVFVVLSNHNTAVLYVFICFPYNIIPLCIGKLPNSIGNIGGKTLFVFPTRSSIIVHVCVLILVDYSLQNYDIHESIIY